MTQKVIKGDYTITDKKWWQEAVVYEIYCKSFCDSDGDGIGDLRGVMSKLPVLRDLGVNCIWFTPIYTSPQVDNGYDVADYHAMIASGVSPKEAIDTLAPRSRDNARTPYQWDATENAGFSTGKPWIKVNPKYKEINLEADRASEDSIFAFYQELIKMRREDPAIIEGDLTFYLDGHEDIIMYSRACAAQTLLVVANYSGKTVKLDIPKEIKERRWARKLTNKKDTLSSLDSIRDLQPWEVEIYELVK